MTPEELKKVVQDLKPICDGLCDVIEFVDGKDSSLHDDLVYHWTRLTNVWYSGNRQLERLKDDLS